MKRRPLSAVLTRMSLGALCFSFTLGGCGATNTSGIKEVPQSAEHCDRQALGICEQTILAAVHEGRDARGWVRAYMDARGSADPWFVLWNHALAANESKLPLVFSEGGDFLAGHASTKAKLIKLDPLPSPASISTDALLVAVGEAAHLDIIVRARAASSDVHRENPPPEVTEIFPRDPLAPFMMGLPPLVRDDHALSHLDADLELASAIRSAVDHASAFRYVEAAKEAEHIETLIRSRDANAETTLRGRYVASLLASAGISLEAAPGTTLATLGDPTLPEATTTTPYGDVLRLRETKDEHIAFQKIGDRILKALHQDKQSAVRAMYAPRETCLQVSLDGFDAPDDLFLANWVGRTLQSSLASPKSSTNTTLALTDWLPRYETLVRNVDEANTTWSHAFALTQERGEIGGVSLRTTATHKRVDTLVAAHLAGLLQLVQTNPERVRLMSIVTLAYARGIIGTPTLRDALVDLLRRAVETRMAHATDASALFEASAAGVLAATAYPTAIQGPVYGGLFSAFHDKLNKDFSRQTGWGVAGLFAADAVAGFLAGNPSDLGPVSREISRALEDPALSERSLGRLVAAAAQYLALGVNHELDPDAVDVARWPASRKAARQALREAVAGLNDPSAALSEALLDDVAMLGDQTMTAIATIIQDKPSGGGPVCSNSSAGPSPAARRVLARVGDLRRKVLAHPALNKGGVAVSRLRVAITVLSDAIDIVSRKRKDKPVTFTISDADAERTMSDAMVALGDNAVAQVVSSGYGIARRWLGGFTAKGLAGSDVDRARQLIVSLSKLFRDESTGTSVTLFDALARAASTRAGTKAADPSVELVLVDYARTLRALGKPDQADLCLLGAMVVSVITERTIGEDAISAADAGSSDLAWTLRFAQQIFRVRSGLSPDPTAYAKGMRDAVARSCEDPSIADQVVLVMDAIRLASMGERTKARTMLEDVLAKIEADGLVLPRMNFKYEEKTVSKVFSTSLEVSLGAGLLDGSSRFQIGLGIRSPGQPEGSITANLLPDSPERDAEMVRYYVHVGAAAALLHFLDGDPERGATTAARVVDAAFFGLRLGQRPVAPADPKTTASDARGVLAVVAVLAADAGMPLLAGDVWALIRATLASDVDDEAIEEILGHLPVALSVVSSAKPPIERAKRALRVVAEPLACTEQKVELGGFEAPACDEYPYALALRAGGALRKLPHLRRDSGKTCSTSLSALDTFLVGVEKGGYDPDAFTRAVSELVTAGRTYDAAVLLARQRQPSHCNQSLVAAARSVGRSPFVGRNLRADVLSVAVNCSLLDEATLADISLVDQETAKLSDRGRNLALLAFAAELGMARDRWDVLGRLAKNPTFVARWLDTNPQAAMFAAVLARAAAILAKEPSAAEAASGVVDLFCVKLPRVDSAACESIDAMQTSAGKPEAAAIAKKSVDSALQRLSALRAKR